jgi:flagellar basal-body rod protein FlgB
LASIEIAAGEFGVSPIYLMDLAAQHAQWASARQAAITGNIANANTANFMAQDIAPFSASLQQEGAASLARTQLGHLDASGTSAADGGGYSTIDTGAPVALDRELVKADDVNRTFALDTTIMRAFQRMMLLAVRSGA